MATTFPSLVEWMEAVGFNELHALHAAHVNGWSGGRLFSFTETVEDLYNTTKEEWHSDMYHNPKFVNWKMDLEQDMCLESAKQVLQSIINTAIVNGAVAEIVVNDELAPDHETALCIVNDFMQQLIPAVDRMLNGLK